MKIFTFKRWLSINTVYLITLLIPILITNSTLAQSNFRDDPNRDQIPHYYLNLAPQNPDLPISSIITVDNWDNFNLGVDFAENTMTENPAQPTWYFTAYNTNAPHHTENGIDWFINTANFGTTVQGDPVNVYDSLGNLFYENMYGNITGCKVIKSTDNGTTWTPAVTAISGVDKNWMSSDQTSGPYANYIYTTMTSNSGGNFARSTDHGVSFQNTFHPTTQSNPGMSVCVGPNNDIQGGSVYVVTNSGSAFASVYTFYRSTNGGQNFTQMSAQQFANYVGTNVGGRNSVSGMRTRPYPFITADNSYGSKRGRLYLIYASNDPPGDNHKPDVWCRYSNDGGTSWSTAIKVNDDPNTTANNQWHPATWCDKETGRLYVQWMDTRDTPTSDSAYIYASYSDDGGVTFVPNQRISNKKMKINCPTCGGGGTPRYQGDYNGIISNKNVAMAGWADFRNGSFMSTTAYFPDFAMAIDHDIDTLNTPADDALFVVSVPEVKLYTDTVIVSATVDPTPSAGTITFTFPNGNKITSFPNSLDVHVVLSGSVPNGTYQVAFYAKGPNGTPAHKRTAMIKVLSGGGFMATATATPPAICLGLSSDLQVNVVGGVAPFAYAWTPSATLSDPTVFNPIATPTVTTAYHVIVTDATSNTTTADVTVTVNNAPPTPGTIEGPSVVCQDSTWNYTINEVIGATSYSWTVPDNAIITSGQNTPTITVFWGNTSGNISVIAGNDCGTSAQSAKYITVNVPPVITGQINGPGTVCQQGVENFYLDSIPGVTNYNWMVPPDAQINSGQGTRFINLTWGSVAGNLLVSAFNNCGISEPVTKSIEVDSVPVAAGNITGTDTVCLNRGDYTYNIPVIPNASEYVWSLPSGAEITAGTGTREITVYFGPNAVLGNISVFGRNDCGDGEIASKGIIVTNCAGIGENNLNAQIMIYPNPNNGLLNLAISGQEQQLRIEITDMSGHIRYSENLEKIPQKFHKKLDISGLSKGLYFIKLSNKDRNYIEKIVVQ